MVAAARRVCPRAIIHADASQALGKVPVHPVALGVDLLTSGVSPLTVPSTTLAACTLSPVSSFFLCLPSPCVFAYCLLLSLSPVSLCLCRCLLSPGWRSPGSFCIIVVWCLLFFSAESVCLL